MKNYAVTLNTTILSLPTKWLQDVVEIGIRLVATLEMHDNHGDPINIKHSYSVNEALQLWSPLLFQTAHNIGCH